MERRLVSSLVVLSLVGAISAHAANLASDNAANTTYGPPWSWTTGQNGGFGFGAWQLQTAGPVAGFFIWTSTQNADGLDDGNVNGASNDRDIDTQGANGDWVAWGLYASLNSQAVAVRPFTGTPQGLEPGQFFEVDFDNGYVEPDPFRPTMVWVGLLDANLSTWVLRVGFTGGGSQYWYTDANNTTPANTGLGYGDEGLRLRVTIGDDPYQYSALLTRRDGTSVSWAGVLSAPAAGFGAVNVNAGASAGGPAYNFYINSMQIVPEPSTVALAALGAVGLLVRRIRRNS